MAPIWPRRRATRTPDQVWAEWTVANEAGDVATADRCATELVDLGPGSYDSWFEAGLHSKARGRWAESAHRNQHALEHFTPEVAEAFDGANPAAWNLGIAATALGDWPTARRAWSAYGIAGLDGDGRIDVDLGLVPVRINPDRPSLSLQVLPEHGGTEVVWCWRRSPAHAVISSVPLPDSGHRFRDVLLHDGEPKGTRQLDGREVSVFDELVRLEDSGLPTWQAEVVGAGREQMERLADLVGPLGLAVDDWSGIAMMCADCSHGSPEGHHHEPSSGDALRLGLAGDEGRLRGCLDRWIDEHPQVVLADLTFLW